MSSKPFLSRGLIGLVRVESNDPPPSRDLKGLIEDIVVELTCGRDRPKTCKDLTVFLSRKSREVHEHCFQI